MKKGGFLYLSLFAMAFVRWQQLSSVICECFDHLFLNFPACSFLIHSCQLFVAPSPIQATQRCPPYQDIFAAASRKQMAASASPTEKNTTRKVGEELISLLQPVPNFPTSFPLGNGMRLVICCLAQMRDLSYGLAPIPTTMIYPTAATTATTAQSIFTTMLCITPVDSTHPSRLSNSSTWPTQNISRK